MMCLYVDDGWMVAALCVWCCATKNDTPRCGFHCGGSRVTRCVVASPFSPVASTSSTKHQDNTQIICLNACTRRTDDDAVLVRRMRFWWSHWGRLTARGWYNFNNCANLHILVTRCRSFNYAFECLKTGNLTTDRIYALFCGSDDSSDDSEHVL